MTRKLTQIFALFRPCSKTDARCGWLPAARAASARSAAAQEPWDELVHARGRPQIDEPGQDVDEICLRIDSGQLAVPTRSTMWVSTSILDAAIIKDLGKLVARRNGCPAACQGTGYRRQPTHKGSLAQCQACVAAKSMIPIKGGNPLGRPPHRGSLSSERRKT